MRWRHLSLGLAATLLACGPSCAGSPGTLTTRIVPNAIDSEAALVYRSERGTERIELSGANRSHLYGPQFHLQALNDDGTVHLLGDSSTNLYVWRAGTSPIRIRPLDGRTGTVALSPDGSTAVASKHADFDRPQSQWSDSENDALWVIDTASHQVIATIPASQPGLVTRMRFVDGRHVAIAVDDFSGDVDRQDVDLDALSRSPRHEPLPAPPQLSCDSVGQLEADDEGLSLRRPDGGKAELAKVEGRVRGFHDHQPTFSDTMWVDGCRFVVFGYRHDLYVFDLGAETTSLLVEGAADPRPIPGR